MNLIYNEKKIEMDFYLTPKEGVSVATLIWMHGLGDYAANFLNIFNAKNCCPCSPNMKIILLQAPNMKVTINGGEEMPSWYDIISLNKDENSYNFNDVKNNLKRVEKIVNDEINFYNDSSKVFVGGFSQGCCMAAQLAFERQNQLGGFIGLSGFLFPQTNLLQKDTPHMIVHGIQDQTLNFDTSKESYKRILNLNFNQINNMGHNINNDVLMHIRNFLKKFFK